MLVLHKDQVAVLAEALQSTFRQRLCQHVRKCWPRESEGMAQAELLAAVESGILHAANLGVITEREIVRFIDSMFLLGRDFDGFLKLPIVLDILEDAASLPGQKMIRIWNYAKTLKLNETFH